MKPNVVVVVIDALRADRVGPLCDRDLTPRIDQLLDEAAFFTDAYTTSVDSDAAITSFQTGRHPLSNGIINHGRRVKKEEMQSIENITQLPEVLSDAGYATAKIGRPLGRWHRNGFDIYPDLGEGWQAYDRGVKSKIGQFLIDVDPRLRRFAGVAYRKFGKHVEEKLTLSNGSTENDDKADGVDSDIIDPFRSVISSKEDFFTFIHLMDTHGAYNADEETVRLYLSQFEYENTPAAEIANQFPEDSYTYRTLMGRRKNTPVYFSEKWAETEYSRGTAVASAYYDAAVTRADRRVGKLIDSLRDEGEFDDSLFIILADHGMSMTEHDIYYAHHGLYDETVHIPLVIKPPGGRQLESDELIQITDLAPTILSYTTGESLNSPDGKSLRDLIENGESIGREIVLAEESYTQRRRMIRTKNRKLISAVNDDLTCRYCKIQHAPEEELYDLVTDPKETTNIATDSGSDVTEIQKKLEEVVDSLIDKAPEYSSQRSNTIEYDDEEELIEQLEALGYK